MTVQQRVYRRVALLLASLAIAGLAALVVLS